MITELDMQEIELVDGAGKVKDVAVDAAAGALVGAAAGFLLGGPVGAVAGAISAGGHALVISAVANSD